MPLLIAPFSCLQAAYTAGRSENARVKLGRYPNPSRSVAYSSAVAPVAWSSGTVSIKAMAAPFGLCHSRPADADRHATIANSHRQARRGDEPHLERGRGDLA